MMARRFQNEENPRHNTHTCLLHSDGLARCGKQPNILKVQRKTMSGVANAMSFGDVQPHSCF